MIESWLLEYHAKPITQNMTRRMHHQVLARHVREWKESFALLAKEANIPTGIDHITLHVRTLAKGRLTDPDAPAPSVKAALDGLVLAGIIADDRPQFVGPITYHAATKSGVDALQVLVVAEDAWEFPWCNSTINSYK